MSYTDAALAADMREHLLALADYGPGWHAYALSRANEAAKADPIHAGLSKQVREHIGLQAAIQADRVLAYFNGLPSPENIYQLEPQRFQMRKAK